MMAIRLYETARRAVVPFEPGPVVSMYVCGITPYDATHLGHAATYLNYDLLIRRLEWLGHEVRLVRNITDVDDSILPKARQLGVHYLDLAARETDRFHRDMTALNMRPAMAEPRATESIQEIIALIGEIEANGHTYMIDGVLYFDVMSKPSFGELSHYPQDHMISLARQRGGNPDDPNKRHPLDFVLWQPSADDEPSWVSRWGPGRPGWHIECSAMAISALGPTIDLHGGGTDLIFPHHECEIVQSESATGKPFVRHWMHSAMVAYEGEKMSKSLGNLVFVSDLLEQTDPRAIRLALMMHHYRAGFEWHDTDIEEGEALLRRLYLAVRCPDGPDPAPYVAAIGAALDNDLDAPRALRLLDDFASAVLSGGPVSQAPEALADTARRLGLELGDPLL